MESSKLIESLSAYDREILTDTINLVSHEQVLGDLPSDLINWFEKTCDQYGGHPLVAFASYIRNTISK